MLNISVITEAGCSWLLQLFHCLGIFSVSLVLGEKFHWFRLGIDWEWLTQSVKDWAKPILSERQTEIIFKSDLAPAANSQFFQKTESTPRAWGETAWDSLIKMMFRALYNNLQPVLILTADFNLVLVVVFWLKCNCSFSHILVICFDLVLV